MIYQSTIISNCFILNPPMEVDEEKLESQLKAFLLQARNDSNYQIKNFETNNQNIRYTLTDNLGNPVMLGDKGVAALDKMIEILLDESSIRQKFSERTIKRILESNILTLIMSPSKGIDKLTKSIVRDMYYSNDSITTMSLSKTNTFVLRDITIEDILYPDVRKLESGEDKKEYEKEINLYRDIMRSILSNYKDKYNPEIDKYEKDGVTIITSFKLWPLCKWLFDNNKDLQEGYEKDYGNERIAFEKRPVKIKGKIVRRLEKLVKLGLFDIDENRVQSQRNKDLKTLLYHVPRDGVIVALTLELQNCDKSSDKYKKMLHLTLNEYLTSIPSNYKNYDNYYYYFLKSLLTKCLGKYDDILDYFFYYISKHSFGFLINFHDLRYTMNNIFFKKMIHENDFKLLFYDVLNNFKTPLFSKEPHDETDKKLLNIELQNIEASIEMIKTCFKSDIESQIDKDMWEYLKNDTHMTKSFQFANNYKKHFSSADVFDNGLFEQIERESVFDYQIRNEWERVKNKNLDSNKITIIVKCQKCNRFVSYLYNIENEMLDKIGVKPYDFVN